MIFKKILLPVLLSGFLIYTPDLVSQNPRMDGYKGIWYSSGEPLEYGYKFSGGVATFAARHKPNAIYSPEVKKTFFVYSGTTTPEERHLLIMISWFDHRLNVVPKPVIVHDKMGVSEPQDNASLSIDKDGYLWVFISGRGRIRPGLIYKSSKPWSIDGFDKIADTEMISPQPWYMKDDGFLLMFSKATMGRELFFSRSSEGQEWSESIRLAGMGGHFQVSGVYGNRLASVFNYHPEGNIDKRTNVYYIQTDDLGRTWKTADDVTVEIPLTDTRSRALVKDYESEGKLVYLQDLNFDSEGNPVILVLLSRDSDPGPAGSPREWMVIYMRDKQWNFSKICESDSNHDKGSLYITDEEWRVIGPTEQGLNKWVAGGEIALWVSRDEGMSWVKECDITRNSPGNNSFVRRPLNMHRDFAAFWSDGDAEKLSVSRLFFTNEKCSRVWVLPYEMKNDLEKPVRIK